MGILNVTSDSFSDGGRFLSPDSALEQAALMVTEGADIIDVGGESTRPRAVSISVNEELDRIAPVIESIVAELDVTVSIDTNKAEIMQAAVELGASMINDVFALRREGAIEMAAELNCAICLMHMQGEPESMQQAPHYDRLPDDVIDFLQGRVDACEAFGIGRDRLIIDPGFGFGKSDRHNLEILANLDQFAALGLPILVGLSRKQTLGKLTGQSVHGRTAASVAAELIAVQKGASFVRTHNVAATVDAMTVLQAVDDLSE